MTSSPALLYRSGLLVFLLAVLTAGHYCATHTIDFPVYHRTGQQILDQNFSLYPRSLLDAGGAIRETAQFDNMYFRYAPVTAVLFTPFAFGGEYAGAFAFFLLKIGAVGLIAVLVMRLLKVEPKEFWKVCGISFLVGGGYLVEEFRYGNVHFLILFFMVLALYGIERGRLLGPSFLFALAICIKLTPLLFLFFFAVKGRFKLCLTVAGFVIVLLFLPALVVGVQENNALLYDWFRSSFQRVDFGGNVSLKGILFKFLNLNDYDQSKYPKVNIVNFSKETVQVLWLVLSLGLAGYMARVSRRGKETPETRLLEYGMVLTGILLLSPHSTRLYFSYLFFPFCVLTAMAVKDPGHQHTPLIKKMLGLFFLTGTLLPLILPGRQASRVYEVLAPHFFAGLALYFVLGFLANRLRKETGP